MKLVRKIIVIKSKNIFKKFSLNTSFFGCKKMATKPSNHKKRRHKAAKKIGWIYKTG
jgi:hypothetical protein